MDAVAGIIKNESERVAAERESLARDLAKERLPARLEWLVDRPRVLAFVYRIRPSWRPTHVSLSYCTTEATATVFGKTWLKNNDEVNVLVSYLDPAHRWQVAAVVAR